MARAFGILLCIFGCRIYGGLQRFPANSGNAIEPAVFLPTSSILPNIASILSASNFLLSAHAKACFARQRIKAGSLR